MRCLSCRLDCVEPEIAVCPVCGSLDPLGVQTSLPAETALLDGRIGITEAIEQGSLATAYRAIRTDAQQVVTIEEYFPRDLAVTRRADGRLEVDPSHRDAYARGLARFLRDGQALADLDHPGIVRVHDVFTEHDTAYLVTPIVEGQTLRQTIDAAAGLPLAEDRVAEIVGQIVDALSALHNVGLLHLDVRPETVMIGPDGRAMLTELASLRWRVGRPRPKPETDVPDAPPELVDGGDIGPWTDLYWLAMLCHELLVGQRPATLEPQRLRDIVQTAGVGRRWSALLLTGLRPRPEDRPRSVSAWFVKGSVLSDTSSLRTSGAEQQFTSRSWGTGRAQRAGGSGSLAALASSRRSAGAYARRSLDVPAGDGPGLARVLAVAPPGAEINVPAGTYVLERPLDLTRPVTVVGAGPELTRLECASWGHVLAVATSGDVALRGVSLAHVGTEWANVVVAHDGQIELDDVRISGAARWFEGGEGGSGLRLLGAASATIERSEIVGNEDCGIVGEATSRLTIRESVITENRRHGVALLDQARGSILRARSVRNGGHGVAAQDQATLEIVSAECAENGEVGIAYAGAARGLAWHNVVWANHGPGISVNAEAAPELVANQVEANENAGIVYYGRAAGAARENVCRGNQQHGLYIGQQAVPELIGNTLRDNGEAGLAYFGSSGGIARENLCLVNGQHGLFVGDQATPELTANRCRENAWNGIVYRDESGGTATDNVCQANGRHGIYVEVNAAPTLTANRCLVNAWCGINYDGTTSGIACDNRCDGNGHQGIHVGAQASPELRANRCDDNKESGIGFAGTAGGAARKNICTSNSQHGIYVRGQAAPLLIENRCQDNQDSGIAYFDTAGGTADRNICRANLKNGLVLGWRAVPDLLANVCRDNRFGDLVDHRWPPASVATSLLDQAVVFRAVPDFAAAHGLEQTLRALDGVVDLEILTYESALVVFRAVHELGDRLAHRIVAAHPNLHMVAAGSTQIELAFQRRLTP